MNNILLEKIDDIYITSAASNPAIYENASEIHICITEIV